MKKRKKSNKEVKVKDTHFWKSFVVHENKHHPMHQKILNNFFWVIAGLLVVSLIALLIFAF